MQGKELRLKQEYFFVSASISDILRAIQQEYDDLRLLSEKPHPAQ
jgi:glucan phosphorylase